MGIHYDTKQCRHCVLLHSIIFFLLSRQTLATKPSSAVKLNVSKILINTHKDNKTWKDQLCLFFHAKCYFEQYTIINIYLLKKNSNGNCKKEGDGSLQGIGLPILIQLGFIFCSFLRDTKMANRLLEKLSDTILFVQMIKCKFSFGTILCNH